MQKILLLGATGFIGSNIAQELDVQGRDWCGVARNRREDDPRIFALSEQETLVDVLRERPLVINALGGLKPQDYIDDIASAMEEFWTGVHGVLRLLWDTPPPAMLQISSAGTVYGEAPGRPSNEADPPAPRSWYGRMKVVEEALYQQCAAAKGIIYTCARVSNPFGNDKRPTHGLVDVLIDYLRRGETFYARFPEGACRDFIHAPEMAKALLIMADRPTSGIFNVGRGCSTQLSELIKIVCDCAPSARIERIEASRTDVVVSEISTDRFFHTFGVRPEGPSVEDYLKKALNTIF